MAKQPTNPAPAMQQQLQSAGVTDPKHQAAAQKALALGVPPDEIIGWVRDHGKDVLDVVESLLHRFGHGHPPAGGGGTTSAPPAP